MKKVLLPLLLYFPTLSGFSQEYQNLTPRINNYYNNNQGSFNTPNSDNISRPNNDWGMDNKTQSEFSTFLDKSIKYDQEKIEKQRKKGEENPSHGYTRTWKDDDGNEREEFVKTPDTERGEAYAQEERQNQKNSDKEQLKNEVENTRSQNLNQYNKDLGTIKEDAVTTNSAQTNSLAGVDAATQTANKAKAQNALETTSQQYKTGGQTGALTIQNNSLIGGKTAEQAVLAARLQKNQMNSSLIDLQSRPSSQKNDINNNGSLEDNEIQSQLENRPSIRKNGALGEYNPTEINPTREQTRQDLINQNSNSSTLENLIKARQNLQQTNQQYQQGGKQAYRTTQATTLSTGAALSQTLTPAKAKKAETSSSLKALQNRRSTQQNDLNCNGILEDDEVRAQLLTRPTVKRNGAPESYNSPQRGNLTREEMLTIQQQKKANTPASFGALENRASYKKQQ